MFRRVKIRNSGSRAGGKVIHTDPVDGPPRYDLRKPKTLYDPDLENTEEPDPDLSHDPLRIEKDDDPNLNMHDPDLDMGGVCGERSGRAAYSFPRLRLRDEAS